MDPPSMIVVGGAGRDTQTTSSAVMTENGSLKYHVSHPTWYPRYVSSSERRRNIASDAE